MAFISSPTLTGRITEYLERMEVMSRKLLCCALLHTVSNTWDVHQEIHNLDLGCAHKSGRFRVFFGLIAFVPEPR